MRRLPWAVSAALLPALTAFTPCAHAAILSHHVVRDRHAPAGQHARHADRGRHSRHGHRGEHGRRHDRMHPRFPPLAIVTLGATFVPDTVTVASGEPLLIAVSSYVTATAGIPVSGVLAGGALGPDSYLYYGIRPGTAAVTGSVRPDCVPAVGCPDWRTAPRLLVTVVR
jgi:hypothetical protein